MEIPEPKYLVGDTLAIERDAAMSLCSPMCLTWTTVTMTVADSAMTPDADPKIALVAVIEASYRARPLPGWLYYISYLDKRSWRRLTEEEIPALLGAVAARQEREARERA